MYQNGKCEDFCPEFFPLHHTAAKSSELKSLVVLWILYGNNKLKAWQKWVWIIIINVITFPANWSCISVMAIAFMYSNRNDLKKQMSGIIFSVFIYAVVSFFFVSKVYAIVQSGVVFVYPVLKQYNGQKGSSKRMKWFFYIYYPAHLVIIGILRMIIYEDIALLF